MPGRPKTADFWIENVRQIASREPRLGPGPIEKRLLELEAAGDISGGVGPAPSVRTVARILSEFRNETKETQQDYEEVYWPETFEQGRLDWDAAPAFLELLHYYNDPHDNVWVTRYWEKLWPYRQPRPDLKTTLWFSRVTAVAPLKPIDRRLTLALTLAKTPKGNRVTEYELAAIPFSRVKAFSALNEITKSMTKAEIEAKAAEEFTQIIEGVAPSKEDAILTEILGTDPPRGAALTEEAVMDRFKLRMLLSRGEYVFDDEHFRALARKFLAQWEAMKEGRAGGLEPT